MELNYNNSVLMVCCNIAPLVRNQKKCLKEKAMTTYFFFFYFTVDFPLSGVSCVPHQLYYLVNSHSDL